MAVDTGLRVGLLVLHIIGAAITCVGAQSEGSIDIYYWGSTGYEGVEPGSEQPLQDVLSYWTKSSEFTIYNSFGEGKDVQVSLGYMSYVNHASAYVELDRTNVFYVPAVSDLEGFNATWYVNDLHVIANKSLCTEHPKADMINLQLRVHETVDTVDDSTLAIYDVGPLHITCPEITIHVNCPRGTGVVQGTYTNFWGLCGYYGSIIVAAGRYAQHAEWRAVWNDEYLPSFECDNDTYSYDFDVTSYFDNMTIYVPEGRCDNHEHMVEFLITDGQFEVGGRLYITAWCSFEGYDIKLRDTTSSTLEQPVSVVAGDVRSAVDGLTFDVLEDGERSQLVFTNQDGLDENVDLYLGAFITQRPWTNMTREKCNRNKHVFDKHSYDLDIGTAIALNELTTVRERWLASVAEDDALDNICGLWTLVVSVDVVRTIYNETRICNNYVMYNLSFECDTYDLPSKMIVILNPYSQREVGVFYYGPHGSNAYTVQVSGWPSFKKHLAGGHSGMVVERNGYARLAQIQKLVESMEDMDTCLQTANVNERVDEIEGVDEDTQDLPEPHLSGMESVKGLMGAMRSHYAEQGTWDGYSVKDIDDVRDTVFTGDLDNITATVLKGCFDALRDIANGYHPSIDICSAAYNMEWMSMEAPHHWSTGDLPLWPAHEIAYTWANRTLYHPHDCSGSLLWEYVHYLRRYEATGTASKAVFRKAERGMGKGKGHPGHAQYCHRPNRCVRKILRTCDYKKTAGLRAIAEDKQNVCLTYQVHMFHKLRGNALGIADLKRANAKSDYYKPCPADNEIRVRQGPQDLFAVRDGNLYWGKLSPNNKWGNWSMIARSQCDACSDNYATRRRKL